MLFRALAKAALTLMLVGCVACVGPASDRLDGTPVPEGYVDVGNGVRIFYRTAGDGEDVVVVVHGGPGFSMEYLAADLSRLSEGRQLIFYDQRGSGRSTLVSDAADLDAQRFVDDLEALRAYLGLDRLTLLGHSWGAGLAALYASRHPDRLARLVILGGIPLRHVERDQAIERLHAGRDALERERLLARRAAWADDRGDASLCRAYYEVWYLPFLADSTALRRSQGDFCAGGAEALRNKANVDAHTMASLGDYDLRASLSAVAAPALIVHGSSDVFSLSSAQAWVTALPDARLLVLEGVGHFPYLEAPDRFFPAVDAFLRGQWPGDLQAPEDH
jgi:proline iminopeptidase